MSQEELELREEDDEFAEIAAEEDDELLEESELLDEDTAEDEDVPGLETVDPDDLTFGFDETIAVSEVDIDEDVEYDDTTEIDDEAPMTEFETAAPRVPRGSTDAVELAIDEVWATGARTAVQADEK
jgi:hypothetical protein